MAGVLSQEPVWLRWLTTAEQLAFGVACNDARALLRRMAFPRVAVRTLAAAAGSLRSLPLTRQLHLTIDHLTVGTVKRLTALLVSPYSSAHRPAHRLELVCAAADLPALESLRALKPVLQGLSVTTVKSGKLDDVGPLVAELSTTGLHSLKLARTHLAAPPPVRPPTALLLLWQAQCGWVGDLAPLAALGGLRDLALNGCSCRDPAALSPLRGLRALRSLALNEFRQEALLACATGLRSLRSLRLFMCGDADLGSFSFAAPLLCRRCCSSGPPHPREAPCACAPPVFSSPSFSAAHLTAPRTWRLHSSTRGVPQAR